MTQSEREEAANTLLNCIDAVFKQMKTRDAAAHPWIGNMLGTEHLRQLGTSVYIQLNRRGEGVSHPPQDAPAAHPELQQGVLLGLAAAKTGQNTSKPVRTRPKASAGPAKASPEPGVTMFTCPACGLLKAWHMTRDRWPNAVCIDCYKAGRTP